LSRRFWIVLVVALAVMGACGLTLCLVSGTAALMFANHFEIGSDLSSPEPPARTPVVVRPSPTRQPPSRTPTPLPGTGTVTLPVASPATPLPATPLPTETSLPASENPTETLKILKDTILPIYNLADIARRLQGKTGIPPTVPPPAVPLQEGDQARFWLSNADTNDNFQVDATLRFISERAYYWVQDGLTYNQSDLEKLAHTFDDRIYPTDREFFGSEWTPGIDGDPRLYVLYARGLGNVAAYFSSNDEYPPELQKYSNAHEMFVVNADEVRFGQEYTYATLAHEFQHMIHWNQDLSEEIWLNEGFSDLAAFLNGYDIGGHDRLFIRNPNLQLNDWPGDTFASAPHYGASFLFTAYFLDRFGEDATKAVVAEPANGLDSFDVVLKQRGAIDALTGQPIGADDVFIDWAVANTLQDPKVGDGRYAYHDYPQAPKASETKKITNCSPDVQTRSVHQYGAEYLLLRCHGDQTLHFEGSVQVELVPTEPHSGAYAFWSNQGTSSDVTLTHSFDFSRVSGPLYMTYWTWYDLEKDFDYLYVLASTDGQRWDILKTPSGTEADPTGANLGWGYTGASGAGESSGSQNPTWIQEGLDLSQYAGQQVQIRFEYITDLTVVGGGFLLDDVAIPAIGYAADFEAGDGGWAADGFARIQPVLPQRFRLALISLGRTPQVQYIPLAADNSADIPLQFGQGVDQYELVVTGTTRYTRQPAAYRFWFGP
jgi:immune inhibitor A